MSVWVSMWPIIRLFGLIAILCSFILVQFLIILFIIVRKMGGRIESRAILTVTTTAAMFFMGGVIMFYL